MSRFYVGQSVRVYSPSSENHGWETTIIRLNVFIDSGLESYFGHEVAIPCTDPRLAGRLCVFEPRELIPISDRNETTTWEKCAWSPHGLGTLPASSGNQTSEDV